MPQQNKSKTFGYSFMKIFFTIVLLASCNPGRDNKTLFKNNDVVKAEIKQVTDSLSKQMNPVQIEAFVKKWNHSRSKGTTKFLAEYILSLHLKNGDSVMFMTRHALIKQSGDATYTIYNRDFFSNLYLTAK